LRDIKFRGQKIDGGDFVVGYFTKNDVSGNCYITTQSLTGGAHPHPVYPESVGQYSDHFDLHGNDIYEKQRLKIEILDFSTKKVTVSAVETVEFQNGKFGVAWGIYRTFTALSDFSPNNTRFEIVKEA
jgi:hypothetical protein